MKISRTYLVLLASSAIIVVFAAGFTLGGRYASARAVSAANHAAAHAEFDHAVAEADKWQTAIAGMMTRLDKFEPLKANASLPVNKAFLDEMQKLGIKDSTLEKAVAKYQDVTYIEASLLRAGFKQQDPEIAAGHAEQERITRQMADQLESIEHSLRIQLDIAQKTVDSINTKLERLKGLRSKQDA